MDKDPADTYVVIDRDGDRITGDEIEKVSHTYEKAMEIAKKVVQRTGNDCFDRIIICRAVAMVEKETPPIKLTTFFSRLGAHSIPDKDVTG